MIGRIGLLVFISVMSVSSAHSQRDQLMPPPPVSAADRLWHCPDVTVRVRAISYDAAKRVCAAAKAPLRILGECGLSPKNVITVHVTDTVFTRFGVKKRGEFLVGTSLIRVISYDLHQRILPSRFHNIDVPAAALYSSVVAHEIAHAIFSDNSGHLDLPNTAHEYTAYVVQMKSFSAGTRARILARDAPIYKSNLFMFSHFLMLADPDRFGVNAYIHFEHPENGCAFIAKVLRSIVHFPPPSD